MARNRVRWLSVLALLAVMLPALPSASHTYAQAPCRTFPETGKTVCDKFLTYWTGHGGLAQQGYPISDAAAEKSDTDGKVYITQYFERAVFEQHPEFAPPNDVLLSLLGVFRYQQKYPAGAPGQVANSESTSRAFPATGKHVGGVFLNYWTGHGGLAQQGYPISEEFNEVSDLNGQTYRVQYFERAVFELHPEFAPPNNVLLSQLGTFRLRDKQTPPTPAATPTSAVPPTSTPPPATATPPPPQATPTSEPCAGIPDSIDMQTAPASRCGRGGTIFLFLGHGFQPGENVGAYVTDPTQAVFGANFQFTADSDGYAGIAQFTTAPGFPLGIWAITFEGVDSHHRAIGYFKIIP
ncbi:MAG: hypothetical protein ACJ78Q_05530 [Chloroflexia bacterium]